MKVTRGLSCDYKKAMIPVYPRVGVDTINTMQEVKASALAIEAGKTLMFDREKMLDAADKAGISVVSLRWP